MRLTQEQLQSRLRFDWHVLSEMWDPVVVGWAYASTSHLERRWDPVESIAQAHRATKYRVDYHVPTLIGPGTFAPVTTIGFDLAVGDYPYQPPATWVVSEHIPYSPHFRRGAPVCIGDFWEAGRGQVLLAHLVIHVARLLNWDEVLRGGGYVGWNREAIEYWRRHYQRPLNPGLRLPSLPSHLTHGTDAVALFEPVEGAAPGGTNAGDLFGPA
ncbi:MAG TPA: hypothetical protein VOB72_26275 [Candidatus Dormibacteraeota bacterium]|nr:hypothetical protein [Candidatus Dormibacteraeota bacterium]